MKRAFITATVVSGLVGASFGAEYFTERFRSGDFDLLGMSLTFTPDASADSYSVSAALVSELPVSTTGHSPLGLGDDSAEFVRFSENSSKSFLFYGVRKYGCYVGSNGYITLEDAGDGVWQVSEENHFSTSRISTAYRDWYPPSGGQIYLGYLSDRFVVTFVNIHEISSSRTGTFQTEIFYSTGAIRMSWIDLNPVTVNCLVGLSEGNGMPADYVESDLSGFATDLDGDGILDDWERYFFSHYTNCQPTANFDGDTLDNRSEYICGSDPLDPESYFFCVTGNTPAGPAVAWPILEGRTYTVLKTTDLGTTPFTPYQSGFVYPNNAFTDTVSSVSGFYKVEVELTE